MKKNKNKIYLCLLAALGASFGASAKLYISPVVKGDAVKNSTEVEVPVKKELSSHRGKFLQVEPTKDGQVLVGASKTSGKYMMRESSSSQTTMRYGKNVPLFKAIEAVVPDSESWKINIQDGLQSKTVNWDGGHTWQDVLDIISSENNVRIKINYDEQAIGVSDNAKMANYLAKKNALLWVIDKNLSLRANLSKWSKKAGWTLEWDPSLKDDYLISHSATLTGQFLGVNGVVDQVLNSMRSHSKPLSAKFLTKNKVLLITEAGYEQEVRY